MSIKNHGYANEYKGRAGHIRNSQLCKRISRSAPAAVAEVRTITIGAVSDSTTYTDVIDGISIEHTTPSSGNTTSTRAELLYQAILANDTLGGRYITDVSAAVVTLTAREANSAFAITAAADATAALVTAASAGSSVAPGLSVCDDPDLERGCLLPAASITKGVYHLTPATPDTGDTYKISIVGDLDGDGEPENYDIDVSAGATVQASVELIQPALNAISGLTVTEDDTKAVITVDKGGVPLEISVQVTGGNGSTLAIAENTAPSSGLFTGRLLGPVLLEQDLEMKSGGGLVSYDPSALMTIGAAGEHDLLLVEGVTVKKDDPVYVVADGSADAGKHRADDDGGNAILDPKSRFISANFTGLDGQPCASAERL